MIVTRDIPPEARPALAALYWEAFGSKLGKVLGPRPKALQFIERVLQTNHGIFAIDSNGEILGVVGFKTPKGAFVGGEFNDMRAVYGLWGSIWRALIVTALERDIDNERFLMDGIVVAKAHRGKGVGSALLEAIASEARSRGFDAVRLDVVDTNPRARALYERHGFRAVQEHRLGPLRYVFGFRSSTMMVRALT